MKSAFWLPFLLVAALGAAQRPPGEFEPLKIIRTVEPFYPLRLQQQGVKTGEARVVINVDDHGQLQDFLVTGYSRKEFADSAVAALKRWKYEPIHVGGEPYPTTQEIVFTFESHGLAVVSQTLDEHIEQRLDTMIPDRHSYRIPTLRELDALPVPREVVAPAYPRELAEKGVTGRVSVEFYIDEEGRVRLPVVLQSPDRQLSAEAVTAVQLWRFDPPRRSGRPVAVRVIQDFNFTPAK